MNATLAEEAATLRAAVKREEPSGDQAVTLEQLSQAVADNALLNAEVDRKIVTRLMEAREEIKATQRDVQNLQQQFAQFVRNLGQVIEATQLDMEIKARKKS